VRTISYHGCKGQGKLSTHTQTKFKKAKKNQTSTNNLGKHKKKTVQRKLIIRLRRSTTLLWHPELEGAFSAGTKGVSIVAGIRTIHGKAQEKTVQRKLIIKLRRSATLLWHPELEGAFSAWTKGVSITAGICTRSLFLFGGLCERSTPFPLRSYESPIFRTTEIPFALIKYATNPLPSQ
jgi:hypothetical protein